ncbi:MAG: glycosyltransferase family 39 protein [Candidatus Omnitrophica bacterium]|nr:glycosyltransferase family 39 protein [Candidatus Omnitrophota bacterium]
MKLTKNRNKYPASFFIALLKKRAQYLILVSIALFYAITNFIWLKQNTYPSGPDEATHLLISSEISRLISFDAKNIFLFFTFGLSGQRPPLFHFASAVLNIFLGTSYIASVTINIVYLLILLVSVYFIGRKLFNKSTALIAVIVTCFYPLVFRYSRFFGPDFALTAAVSMSICFLIYAEQFKQLKYSIFFGVSLGLGMLTKATFALFMIGPLAYALGQIFNLKIINHTAVKNRLLNLAASCMTGFLLIVLGYLPILSRIFETAKISLLRSLFLTTDRSPSSAVSFLERLSYILQGLFSIINDQISFLFAIIFTLGLFFYLLRAKKRLFLISWYLFPFLLLSASLYTEARLMLPALPALALITAAGLDTIRSKKYLYPLYTLIVLLGLLQFLYVSYYSPGNNLKLTLHTPWGPVRMLYFPTNEHRPWSYGPPYTKNWKIAELAESIETNYIRNATVGIICQDKHAEEIFSQPGLLDYYLTKTNYVKDSESFDLLQPSIENKDILKFLSNLNRLNCIIFISKKTTWPEFGILKTDLNDRLTRTKKYLDFIKIDSDPDSMSYMLYSDFKQEALAKFKEFINQGKNKFSLAQTVNLPDGYYAYIYIPKDHCFLKKSSLALTFVRGSAFLYYKDKTIAPQQIDSSFRHGNKIYESANAFWKAEKISSTALQAQGTWEDLPGITQILRFELNDKGKLTLRAALKTKDSITINDAQTCVSFSKQHALYESSHTQQPYAYVALPKDSMTAALIFSADSSDDTDFIVKKNVRLFKPTAFNVSAVKGSSRKELVLPGGTHSLTSFSVEIFSNQEDWRKGMRRIEQTYSLVKDKFRLLFFDGRAHLFYDNNELTAEGIETSFKYENKVYDSSEGFWEIKKTVPSTLQAQGTWEDLPGITEVWEFTALDENEINYSVRLKPTGNPMNIDGFKTAKIEFTLNDKYKQWINGFQQGVFTAAENSGAVLNDAAAKSIGMLVGQNKIKSNPALFFIMDKPDYSLMQLHYSASHRTLIHWTDINNLAFSVEPDNYLLFKGKIRIPVSNREVKKLTQLQTETETDRRKYLKSKYSLTRGDIKVFFDFGLGRIYYKDKEITSGFGLYTSILSDGFWHDSQNILWQTIERGDNMLQARGIHIDLPIAQLWTIRLNKENLIEWEVTLDVDEAICLNEVQANIILSQDYQRVEPENLHAIAGPAESSRSIEFILDDPNVLCWKKNVAKADFLNSKALVFRYYSLNQFLQPEKQKNYFKGSVHLK